MKKNRILKTTVWLVLLVFSIIVAGCSAPNSKSQDSTGATASTPPQLKKLKVGYNATGGSLLSFIAQDQGLFQKAGLDVELIPFSSTSDGLNALSSGKIDLGVSFGTGGPLTLISNGADFVIIGGHLSGGHPIIALPERANEFKTMQDYKGKTVAVPRLFTSDIVWRGGLAKAGLDYKTDVNIIESKTAPAVLEAVKSGKVDVGIGTSSIYLQAKEAGMAIVGWSNDIFPEHPCCRIVARGEAVTKDPAVYQAYLEAIIQAEKLKSENPELAVAVNKKFLNLDDAQAQDFTLEPHQNTTADPNRKGVLKMWEEMHNIGYIQGNVDIEQHINTALYKKALTSVEQKYPNDKYYQMLEEQFARQN
ncbi:MAG TPA: ABC transporter substrate-binding protein [Negativicutes bacterium]|jgi:NitT/TauT family transport system substrate-binding protein